MIDGLKIKELRKKRGWTQAQLAQHVGVSQPTIASMERGDQNTARSLPRVARALEAEITNLDPDFPAMILSAAIDPRSALTAFEVMMERLLPDSYDQPAREGLARLFLDLALEPLDENSALSPMDQHRERLRIAILPYLRR